MVMETIDLWKDNKSIVIVTIGLDSTGVATTCHSNAPFYLKIIYT